MRVLFVCKFNRFRSRVAEAYFNKINKSENPGHEAQSAGLVEGYLPLDSFQIQVAEELGADIGNREPKPVSRDILRWAELLVIVANDVPKSIFEDSRIYSNKIVVWDIPDIIKNSRKDVEKTIKEIMKRVEELSENLKSELQE